MTEEEAKTKWCPFVRSQIVDQDENGRLMCISNRDKAQMVEVNDERVMTHNCIGGSCMTWRWMDRVGGFCGLAGFPQLREPT